MNIVARKALHGIAVRCSAGLATALHTSETGWEIFSQLQRSIHEGRMQQAWDHYRDLLKRRRQEQRSQTQQQSVVSDRQTVLTREFAESAQAHIHEAHGQILSTLDLKHMHAYSQQHIEKLAKRVRLFLREMVEDGHAINSKQLNQLLKFFATAKNGEGANHVWQYATLSGVALDITNYNSYINATITTGQLNRAAEIAQEFRQRGLQPNTYTQASIIRLYGQLGDLTAARQAFGAACRCAEVPAGIAAVGIFETDNSWAAQTYWKNATNDMRVSGVNIHVCNEMLNVLGLNGLVDEMRQMAGHLLGMPNAATAAEINTALASGETPRTHRGLRPNIETFHILVKWHAAYWDLDAAMEYARVMRKYGINPVSKTLKLVVTAMTAKRDVRKCADIAVMMSRDLNLLVPRSVVRILEHASKETKKMEEMVRQAELQRSTLFPGVAYYDEHGIPEQSRLVVVVWMNPQVVPVNKGSWVARFGEPGAPTEREMRLPPLPRKLTLHMLTHSHSDIGWNLSLKGYYLASVHGVMQRVTRELWADERRRFTWGDLPFLEIWMTEEGEKGSGLKVNGREVTWRQAVITLVQRGQLDIVGGGYVSADEGLTTWWAHNSILDVGHRLLEELNTTTRVGWQIDNFGHMNTVAHLLSNTGYQKVIIGRMDFRQQYGLATRGQLQFEWQSEEHGRVGATGLMAHFLVDHYQTPSPRFDFDHTAACDTEVLLDELLRLGQRHVRQYPGHGHVLVMMGDDLRFVKARRAFECLDRLIDAAQRRGGAWRDVELRYTTPSEYFAAVEPALKAGELQQIGGDFFPYQDKPYEQYWSGLLGSRPYLKWLVRDTEQIVQHAETLVALQHVRTIAAGSPDSTAWGALEAQLEFARKQVAVGYHHDSITGTCTDRAFRDYVQRLRDAEKSALQAARSALTPEISDDSAAANTATRDAVKLMRGTAEVSAAQCNTTMCAGATVAVTNANLLTAQDALVRLRVATVDAVLVDAATGNAVRDVAIQRNGNAYQVQFLARAVPPLGLRQYTLGSASSHPGATLLRSAFVAPEPAVLGKAAVLWRGGARVRLAVKANGMVRITVGTRRLQHQLRQYLVNPSVQPSGAYVMHSFGLMYSIVFWIFGGALCAGLATACVARYARLRMLRLPRMSFPGSRRALVLGPLGTVVGVAFAWYVVQIAAAERLNAWTLGNGVALLVAPTFACAYLAAGVLRWSKRAAAVFAQGVALGIALTLLLGASWQSRPLATGPLTLTVERDALCDYARAEVAPGISAEYRLCADAPDLLHVVTRVVAPLDREIVARFAEEGSRASALELFDGVRMRRRSVSRFMPIPGRLHPVPYLAALGPLTIHVRQPTGVAWIAPGTMELLVHRSLSANDFRGLHTPLVDNTPVIATHIIDLRPPPITTTELLRANHRVNAPPLVFVLPSNVTADTAEYSGVVESAPALRLVGIRTRSISGAVLVEARLIADEPVELSVARLLRYVRAEAYEIHGDWTLCDSSAANRTLVSADHIRLRARQQKLFRFTVAV
ncbi:mannosyl-oligosaccharide 1,3-1,6-alpha-mannosidase activity protein [Coemansia sp. RSA 988]|nr:mannosyl-oligosaccharide 1,3-1,6-alpha-mannosidase activity protein [Coemansia sp. RSA 988]